MPTCDVCGNEYDRAFTVQSADGRQMVFDSIECAAHMIAPVCAHCGCRVLGHGVQEGADVYCCAHCAHAVGVSEVKDRV